MVPEEGVEPTRSKAPADFESAASASSATPGLIANLTCRALPLKHLAGWQHAIREFRCNLPIRAKLEPAMLPCIHLSVHQEQEHSR
jgi:hypothetical protein